MFYFDIYIWSDWYDSDVAWLPSSLCASEFIIVEVIASLKSGFDEEQDSPEFNCFSFFLGDDLMPCFLLFSIVSCFFFVYFLLVGWSKFWGLLDFGAFGGSVGVLFLKIQN